MRRDHPVFQGPLPVAITTTEKVDPYTKKVLEVWRVEEDQEEPGLVASRRRFVDAPDSEIVSLGINMKGNRGVPLVREGNLFLWGFAADPSGMTPSGRSAFVNAIVHMKDFGGQRPVRRAGVRSRDRWQGILDSQHIRDDQLLRYFSRELLAQHGGDRAALREHLAGREAYLFVPAGAATYHLDADAEALGQPTHSFALLAAALTKGGEVAERIFQRYWPEDELLGPRPTTRDELEGWRSRIVFSEGHGYRWLARPAIAGPEDWEIEDALAALPGAAPSEANPLTLKARVVGSYNAESLAYDTRFARVTLVVAAQLHEEWHVTLSGEGSGAPPFAITMALPEGMRWLDRKWTRAGESKAERGDVWGLGRQVWTRDVWVCAEAGDHTFSGMVSYQVCDPMMCHPPAEVPFEAALKVR